MSNNLLDIKSKGFKLIISIDYSLESTGITFFSIDDEKYHFLSFINTIHDKNVVERLSFIKNKKISDITIEEYNRYRIFSVKDRADGLYGWQKEHMSNVTFYSNLLSKKIKSIIKKLYPFANKSNTIVLIENYSYSSTSDTLIQLVENTMSLKGELFKSIVEIQNFYCIPAPKVKQYVGKGNYDKFQMCDSFINNIKSDKSLQISPFYSFLKDNLESAFIKRRIKKGKEFNEILSPISDVVDSYWILDYFMNVSMKAQIKR